MKRKLQELKYDMSEIKKCKDCKRAIGNVANQYDGKCPRCFSKASKDDKESKTKVVDYTKS